MKPSEWNLLSVCAAGAPGRPDFPSEPGAGRVWRLPDHFDCRVQRHRALPFKAHHGCKPLAYALRRVRRAAPPVVLPGPPTAAGITKHDSFARVATPASPREVIRAAVFLMPVHVVHFNVALRSAVVADARVWRRVRIRPVAVGAVGDIHQAPAAAGCRI